MSTRSQYSKDRLRTKAGLAWLVTFFVAFCLNYVPVHLVTAAHLSNWFTNVAEPHVHDDEHEHEHGDADDHVPHPASDHALDSTAQTQTTYPSVIVFGVVTDAPTFVFELSSQPLPILERIKPPGESPPDPAQPRAPPIA